MGYLLEELLLRVADNILARAAMHINECSQPKSCIKNSGCETCDAVAIITEARVKVFGDLAWL